MRILLIEDDKNTTNTVLSALRAEGFMCDATDAGEDSLQMVKLFQYDVIILDLMLQDIDGIEVLRRLRASKNNTPIVILSALDGHVEKIQGFGCGADDYVTKPFNSNELIARLHAVVRRSMGYAESVIKVGRLSINLQTKTAEVDGMPLRLTGKEYAILELLMLRKGYTLSKEAFLSHLYDERSEEPAQKIVDVFMCKLRKKLEQSLGAKETYIETIWGRGYMLSGPSQKDHKQTAAAA